MNPKNEIKKYTFKNEFYVRMVETLWSLVDNTAAVNSALVELSKFRKDAFKISYLPSKVLQSFREKCRKLIDAEENKGKSLDEIFPQIQASCYIDLFRHLDETSRHGLGELFKSILAEELDSMPRRIKSLAREKVYSEDEQRAAQKGFYDQLKTYLAEQYNHDLSKQESISESERNFQT